jgi:hypothetical protein
MPGQDHFFAGHVRFVPVAGQGVGGGFIVSQKSHVRPPFAEPANFTILVQDIDVHLHPLAIGLGTPEYEKDKRLGAPEPSLVAGLQSC